jgi:putative endonuclease
MAVNKRKIGTDYEKKAAKYLSMKGYRILQMNYQNRFGELDILAEDKDGTLVVC